jgi:hypothetical protein
MIPKTLCIILSKEILRDGIFAKHDLPLKRLNTTGSGEKEKDSREINLAILQFLQQHLLNKGPFVLHNQQCMPCRPHAL